MKKINLSEPKTIRLINESSDEILEIIDNREGFTRSDLQGVVEATVVKILNKGLNL